VTEDRDDGTSSAPSDDRVLRGGSLVDLPSGVRSAFRFSGAPSYRNYYIGFRPARTFAP
jgi:formylglycine-generating enzyme required for sulfatase activity